MALSSEQGSCFDNAHRFRWVRPSTYSYLLKHQIVNHRCLEDGRLHSTQRILTWHPTVDSCVGQLSSKPVKFDMFSIVAETLTLWIHTPSEKVIRDYVCRLQEAQ